MPDLTDDIVERASTIQGRFNTAVMKARDDVGLTLVGKQQRMARAFMDAQRDLGELQESWKGKAAETSTVLGKDIFGAASTIGADAISQRDADDRASRLKSPGEAAGLLARAEENGDAVLARAVAQHAYSQRGTLEDFGGGWSSVVETYTESRPEVAQKLQDLAGARRNDMATNMRAGMIFSLSKPSELRGIGNLEAVAEPVT